jgi:putative transposase
VFFAPGDPEAYLRLLHEQASRYEIKIAAYCLMPNHVHLVAVPSARDSLHRALKAVHGQYAQRINRMRKLTGHLWQGRYFSSPLDALYFLNVVRYVELNPVKSGLVAAAEDYAWSSAAAHCGLWQDRIITPSRRFSVLAGIADWSRWLGEGVTEDVVQTIRRHASRNLPCGSAEFVSGIESTFGRRLQFRQRGRPPSSGRAQDEQPLTNRGNRLSAAAREKGERPLFKK